MCKYYVYYEQHQAVEPTTRLFQGRSIPLVRFEVVGAVGMLGVSHSIYNTIRAKGVPININWIYTPRPYVKELAQLVEHRDFTLRVLA